MSLSQNLQIIFLVILPALVDLSHCQGGKKVFEICEKPEECESGYCKPYNKTTLVCARKVQIRGAKNPLYVTINQRAEKVTNGQIRIYLRSGQYCEKNENCLSGFCDGLDQGLEGWCSPCDNNKQCSEGKECQNRTCLTPKKKWSGNISKERWWVENQIYNHRDPNHKSRSDTKCCFPCHMDEPCAIGQCRTGKCKFTRPDEKKQSSQNPDPPSGKCERIVDCESNLCKVCGGAEGNEEKNVECNEMKDCPSGKCEDGKCVTPLKEEETKMNLQENRKILLPDVISRQSSQNDISIGGSCGDNSDCESGLCEVSSAMGSGSNGKCSPCKNNEQCLTGTCENEKCARIIDMSLQGSEKEMKLVEDDEECDERKKCSTPKCSKFQKCLNYVSAKFSHHFNTKGNNNNNKVENSKKCKFFIGTNFMEAKNGDICRDPQQCNGKQCFGLDRINRKCFGFCDDLKKRKMIGSSCTHNIDCVTSKCVKNKCQGIIKAGSLQYGYPCQSDVDCKSGKCVSEGAEQHCRHDKFKDEKDCFDDEQCASNYCENVNIVENKLGKCKTIMGKKL